MGKLASLRGSSEDSDDVGVWSLSELHDKYNNVELTGQQWGAVGRGLYSAFPASIPKLPPGVYSLDMDNHTNKPIFVYRNVKADDVYRFPDSLADHMVEEIERFWKRASIFDKTGFLHRRGYLLYGSAGTGKSTIVQQIMTDVVRRGDLVLLCNHPHVLNTALEELRKTEPERNVVCIFEDIDAIVSKFGEDIILSILDGANMINHVLNIATTNYPEKLDKRLVSRPRRFDRVIKILPPSDSVRVAFLKKKLPKGENLKKWTEGTKGMSFAGVAETIISVCCLGNAFDESVKAVKELETTSPTSEEFGSKVGFNNKED
jgi:SpoVK/Ycf46/Vps4 family AAA+-type ATPase